jgi:2-oxoglutarate dehydrogenase E2 component (dihydrolipoamide succinyltransferase)
MSIEIKVPQLPESVSDATLVSWHKKPGDSVGRDENLVDLETDKVVLEVPAPLAGIIKELRVENGATVTSGQILAILEAGEVAAAAAPAKEAQPEAQVDKKGPAANEAKSNGSAGKLAPSAKRMVEELKLDAGQIAGSGRDGRVTKGDVIQHLSAAPAAAPKAARPAAPVQLPSVPGARAEQRVPMTRMRARIAERLIQAQATAAMLTTFNEVDLGAVNEIRTRHKDRFEKSHGVKLGYSSFFIKASIEALRKFPAVNASVVATTWSITSTTTSAWPSPPIVA